MRFRTSVEFENLLKSRFQGIGLKGAGGRPSYSHPLRRSKVLLNPENLFDKTRDVPTAYRTSYSRPPASLFLLEVLLFRDRLKIKRLSLSKLFVSLSKEFINRPKRGDFPIRSRENLHQSCSSPREEAFFPFLSRKRPVVLTHPAGKEVRPGEDLIKRRLEV